MKAEGIDVLFAYPVNPLIEAAAKLDIRTVIVRQERIGLHMAETLIRAYLPETKLAYFVCSMAQAPKTPLAVWLKPIQSRCQF